MVSHGREMPLVRIEGSCTMGQELREQTSWSNRRNPILFSMPQEQLLERHLLDLETPGPGFGHHNLQVPFRSLPETLSHHLGNLSSDLGIAQKVLICFAQPCCISSKVLLVTFGIGTGQALNQASIEQQQTRNARCDPPHGTHQPGSSFSHEIRRRDRADQTASREPLRNLGGASQRIGATSGESFSRKALEAQVVSYFRDIIGPIEQPGARFRVRAPNGWSVQTDQSYPRMVGLSREQLHFQP